MIEPSCIGDANECWGGECRGAGRGLCGDWKRYVGGGRLGDTSLRSRDASVIVPAQYRNSSAVLKVDVFSQPQPVHDSNVGPSSQVIKHRCVYQSLYMPRMGPLLHSMRTQNHPHVVL